MESPREVTEVCPYGGWKCPYCGAEILTPKGFILVPGQVECQVCSRPISVSAEAAAEANHQRTLSAFTHALLDQEAERRGNLPLGA
jgi:hypothetical protein